MVNPVIPGQSQTWNQKQLIGYLSRMPGNQPNCFASGVNKRQVTNTYPPLPSLCSTGPANSTGEGSPYEIILVNM